MADREVEPLEREVAIEQMDIAGLPGNIELYQEDQANAQSDIAQQQTNLDNAPLDYQSAVDRDNAYYDSQEKTVQPDGSVVQPDGSGQQPGGSGKGDGSGQETTSGQETQDSKTSDTPEPDKPEHPCKQPFLDRLMAQGYSEEDALKEWQDLASCGDPERIAIVTAMLRDMSLADAERLRRWRKVSTRNLCGRNGSGTRSCLSIAGRAG